VKCASAAVTKKIVVPSTRMPIRKST
jgi:hypothetical protein